jgi:hypothetical protein
MQIKTQEALHEHLGSLKEKTPAVIKIPQGSKMVEIALTDKRLTINRYFSALKDLDLGKYPLRYVVSDSYAYRDRLKEVGIDRPVDSIRIMDAVLHGKDIDRFAKGETRAEDMMTMFLQLGSQLSRSPNVPWYQLLRDAQPYIGSLPGPWLLYISCMKHLQGKLYDRDNQGAPPSSGKHVPDVFIFRWLLLFPRGQGIRDALRPHFTDLQDLFQGENKAIHVPGCFFSAEKVVIDDEVA